MSHARVQDDQGNSVPEQVSDCYLVDQALQGNSRAFETIMRRHNRLLFRTARSILGADADAEDALQDAYLQAWRRLDQFRGDARLSTWLVRIIVNESLGRQRRQRTELVPLDIAMHTDPMLMQRSFTDRPMRRPERSAMRSELRAILEQRIDALPEKYRTVFILHAVEELSFHEVSQALQMPEATARTRFFRARGLLQQALATDIDLTLPDAFSFGGERCDYVISTVLAKTGQQAGS